MNMKLSWYSVGDCAESDNIAEHVWKIAESVVRRICLNEKIYYIIQHPVEDICWYQASLGDKYIFCFANMKHELVADFPINKFAMSRWEKNVCFSFHRNVVLMSFKYQRYNLQFSPLPTLVSSM